VTDCTERSEGQEGTADTGTAVTDCTERSEGQEGSKGTAKRGYP
jgi:hypothetical protein